MYAGWKFFLLPSLPCLLRLLPSFLPSLELIHICQLWHDTETFSSFHILEKLYKCFLLTADIWEVFNTMAKKFRKKKKRTYADSTQVLQHMYRLWSHSVLFSLLNRTRHIVPSTVLSPSRRATILFLSLSLKNTLHQLEHQLIISRNPFNSWVIRGLKTSCPLAKKGGRFLMRTAPTEEKNFNRCKENIQGNKKKITEFEEWIERSGRKMA